MSKHGIEMALWEAAFLPGNADQLREHPDAYAVNIADGSVTSGAAYDAEV